MNTMNTLRTTLLAGLMAVGVAAPSLAQSPAAAAGAHAAATPGAAAAAGRHGHAATRQERQARRSAHMAKRQARLHDALKLTATQESAWSSYQSALRPAPAAARGQRGDWATLSAPARLEQQLAMAKQRTARMETRLAALNSFYGVLTSEQKKTFDEAGTRGKGQRGGHHGHHGNHGHHGKDKVAQA